jgi:hypothetical protein
MHQTAAAKVRAHLFLRAQLVVESCDDAAHAHGQPKPLKSERKWGQQQEQTHQTAASSFFSAFFL